MKNLMGAKLGYLAYNNQSQEPEEQVLCERKQVNRIKDDMWEHQKNKALLLLQEENQKLRQSQSQQQQVEQEWRMKIADIHVQHAQDVQEAELGGSWKEVAMYIGQISYSLQMCYSMQAIVADIHILEILCAQISQIKFSVKALEIILKTKRFLHVDFYH
eukprot:TRINITY_DN23386_c1_g1_i1.p1 TRINITY_DN23386_c1_g1~~TRINITY_DN23386_c1_g1_i1.p1  ORF type:complete len:160 (-),score=17.12 TRINITY_DN23386_c1_g1_i1:158-637(-)